MKPTTIYWLLIAVLSLAIINVYGQASTQPTDNTLLVLRKFRQDYCKSLLGKKVDPLQAYYSDNIRLMPPFQKTIIGRNNATAYYRAFADRFDIRAITRNEMEVLDVGSQIMETGVITMQLVMKSNGKEYVLAGKYLNLWEELENGGVRLITEAWNYDQYYGEVHDQLRFEEIPSMHAALQPNVLVNNSISFELAALNRLLDAAVTQHDASTWSLYYTDDSMLLASYYPALKGKKAIDDYIHEHVKELPIFEELDIRNDHIDNLGAFVIEYASHIASWKNGDSSGVSFGKNIRVWRREPDHSLKLFRSIGMYD
jgi:ketosteroid isomerase-like protein